MSTKAERLRHRLHDLDLALQVYTYAGSARDAMLAERACVNLWLQAEEVGVLASTTAKRALEGGAE